jgi:hypothetical protein
VIEPLLLSTTRVSTFDGDRLLTGASGFFFERGERLFLVTSRHVMFDEPSRHRPNRIEIEFHADAENLTRLLVMSVLLYHDGTSVWRQGRDSGGGVDVAAIELDLRALPASVAIRSFTPAHLQRSLQEVEVGSPLLIVGFPLGFHDTLHHLPVVRHAVIASSFGLRFQGQGYFLTDARTHRGTSGAPVVMRCACGDPQLPWKLLGVHSARMDMGGRDLRLDESLGLNCAWYADILVTLTADADQHNEPEPAVGLSAANDHPRFEASPTMTYLFKSKAAGDVLMLGPSGEQLLRIIGKEPLAKGIIELTALPAAIKAIESAIAREEAQGMQGEAVQVDPTGTQGEGVTLRQRAWPLLEMMRSAHAAAKEIVWGV